MPRLRLRNTIMTSRRHMFADVYIDEHATESAYDADWLRD
jgi:hypothetical protein